MKIDRLILGEFQTNCYVVRTDESALDCVVIDAGLDADGLIGFLEQHRINPVATILTHGHADHIVGTTALRRRYPQTKVYIHELDAPLLADPRANLSVLVGLTFTAEPADVLLHDDAAVEEAGIQFRVLHTPGHTPGGICLYAESDGVVFAGDTLFADSVGRTDFPGGDMDQLIESIRRKLFPLPENTVVHPGHGMRTTIGREKRNNPYVHGL